MEFIAQGKVLSKVDCHIERQKQAERSNTHIDEVPLKYGSVRLGINLIQFEGVTYTINRTSIDLGVPYLCKRDFLKVLIIDVFNCKCMNNIV